MSNSTPRQSNSDEVRRPEFRKAFYVALIPAVILAGRLAKSEVVHVPTSDGGTWAIEITPAGTQPTAASRTVASKAALAKLDATLVAQVDEPQTEQAPVPPQANGIAPPPQPAPQVEPAPPAEVVEHGMQIVPNQPMPTTSAYSPSEFRKIYDSIPFNSTEYLANPSYRLETAMELLTGNQRLPRNTNYTPQLNGPIPRSPQFLYNRYAGFYGGGMGLIPGAYGGFPYGFNYTPGYPPAFRYFLPLEDLY